MGFFTWKDTFSIGNEKVDRQHRLFLETLNDYYEITFGGNSEVVDKELINKLKNYAVTHFRFEEDLMESVAYDEIERHCEQHSYFKSLVREFESADLHGKSEKLSSAAAFLRDWFLNHILDEDKKYVPFVQAAGKS